MYLIHYYYRFLQNTTYTFDSSVPFRCPHCDLQLGPRKCNYVRHLQLHKKAPHTCRLCTKSFHRKNEIEEHMAVIHGGQRHTCEQCNKDFMTKKAMKLHIASHSGVYKFVCDHCGEGFNYPSNFDAHVNRHKGLKPYSCNTCKYKTGSKSDLTKHKNSCGISEKNFECYVCHNMYKTKKGLAAHKKAHTNPHSFVCCTCGKGYPFQASLINHERKCNPK